MANKMKANSTILAASAAMALVSGCTTVSVRTMPLDSVAPTQNAMPYSLPRGLVQIKAERKEAGGKIEIAAPVRQMTGDERVRLALVAKASAWSDDKFVFDVDENGLLNSINGDHHSKVPEIVGKVVEIAVDVAKAGGGRVSLSATDTISKNAPKLPPFLVQVMVDPFDAKSIAAASARVGAVSGLKLEFTDLSGTTIKPYSAQDVRLAAETCARSACFRILRPVVARLSGGEGLIVSETVLLLPDPLGVYGIDVTRAACVHKLSTLTFVSGVLTKYDLTKPSEILGCLSIPSKIVTSIVGFPKAKADYQKANLEAQKGLLEAQKNLITAQAQLLAAQKP